MELLLNEDRTLLADSAARLSRDLGGIKRVHAAVPGEIDRSVWGAIAKAGWLDLFAPGAEAENPFGVFDLALILHEMGRHWLVAPIAPVNAALRALAITDTSQHAPLLRAVGAGDRIVVPAVQGCGTAFHPEGPLPAIRRDGGKGFLDGEHRYIPAVTEADELLVAASEAGTPCLLLVFDQTPGIEIESKPTFDHAAMNNLVFSDVALSDCEIVASGPLAARLIEETRQILAIAVSAELLGLGESALALTLDQLKTRKQFGRLIGSFQALQHRAVDCFVALELLKSLVFRVAAAFDDGSLHPAMIPALKAKAGASALMVIRQSLQMHGAMGFTQEHDIGVHYKRALALSALYGNEADQLSRFAALTEIAS